jgi:hypothetical protein
MIDFPLANWLDDAASIQWLEQHLHPNGCITRIVAACSSWYQEWQIATPFLF